MWQSKASIREAVNRAMDMLAGRDRGDIVEHGTMAAALGVDYGSPPYYNLVSKIKRALLAARGIDLECVPLIGYQLNDPRGTIWHGHSLMGQGARRFRKGAKIVAALPDDDITDMADKRAKIALVEAASEVERKAREKSQLLAMLMRPSSARGKQPPRPDETP